MREKTLKLVVTFQSTSAAIAMEKYCKETQTPGRLIPVPRAITSNCGMAWLAEIPNRDALEKVAQQYEIPVENWYELML